MTMISRRTLVGAAVGTLGLVGQVRAKVPAIDKSGFESIGGIDQWISIRGKDPSAPALLFLHGGPGQPESPYLDELAPWEEHFLVVNWDQRGSGKSYGRNGAATPDMTLERFIADAIEVAEHVRSKFRKQKMMLVGHSWGSALGLNVVKRRPDLFSAFVGTGQSVDWAKAIELQTKLAREQAAAAGDQDSVRALDAAALLPTNDIRRLGALGRWTMSPEDLAYLQRVRADVYGPQAAKATGEVADYIAGLKFSREKLSPFVFSFNARNLGLDFKLPVFVIDGRDDHITPVEFAQSYIADLRAPSKDFILIDGGHFACFSNAGIFAEALRTATASIAL